MRLDFIGSGGIVDDCERDPVGSSFGEGVVDCSCGDSGVASIIEIPDVFADLQWCDSAAC